MHLVAATMLQGRLWRGRPKSFELGSSKPTLWELDISCDSRWRVSKAPALHQTYHPAQTGSSLGWCPWWPEDPVSRSLEQDKGQTNLPCVSLVEQQSWQRTREPPQPEQAELKQP